MSEGGGKVAVRLPSKDQKDKAVAALGSEVTQGRVETAVEVRQYLISIGQLMGMGEKEYVPVAGLVAVFHLYGGAKKLWSDDPVPFRCIDMGCKLSSLYDVGFRVRSHAIMPDGSEFSAMGEACPHNTTSITRDSLQRMAETRGNGRVLRLATNSGLTCLEELNESEWAKAQRVSGNGRSEPKQAKGATVTDATANGTAAPTAAAPATPPGGLSPEARSILDMLQRLGINRPGDQLRVVREKFKGCRSVQDLNREQVGALVDTLQNALDDTDAKDLFLRWYNGIPA